MFTLETTKIAVPTCDGVVDDHFGHCAYYTIYTTLGTKVTATDRFPSPEGCGCKSGIAPILAEQGVKIMLAGNMGEGAKRVLEQNNIRVIRGCQGAVDQLILDFLAGCVEDSGEGCLTHECHDHHD